MAGRLIKVHSEAEAWKLLAAMLSEPEREQAQALDLRFEGWPKFNLYIEVDNHVLRPTVMRGLLDFQEAIWRAFALVKAGEANVALLTDEEKAALELEFRVNGGSLELLSEAWKKLEPFIPEAMKKMEGRHVVTCVLGLGLLYFGADVVKAQFQARLDEKKAELASTEKIKLLDTQQFVSAQETEHMKILEKAYEKVGILRDMLDEAESARLSILKSLPSQGKVRVQGVETTGALANELARNPRRVGRRSVCKRSTSSTSCAG